MVLALCAEDQQRTDENSEAGQNVFLLAMYPGNLHYSASLLRVCRYSSHSIGSICFFLLLHSLQAGTMFPLVDLPPLMIGTIWSIVSSCTGNSFPQ